MNYNKLGELQTKKNVSNREIAKELEISDTGYKKMIENQTLTVKVLEKLADFYKVSISVFFDDKPLSLYPENNEMRIVEDYLPKCKACEEKDKRIFDLEMHRDDLRKQLGLGKLLANGS